MDVSNPVYVNLRQFSPSCAILETHPILLVKISRWRTPVYATLRYLSVFKFNNLHLRLSRANKRRESAPQFLALRAPAPR